MSAWSGLSSRATGLCAVAPLGLRGPTSKGTYPKPQFVNSNGANLRGANLEHDPFRSRLSSRATGLWGRICAEANLKKANLPGANLKKANLQGSSPRTFPDEGSVSPLFRAGGGAPSFLWVQDSSV